MPGYRVGAWLRLTSAKRKTNLCILRAYICTFPCKEDGVVSRYSNSVVTLFRSPKYFAVSQKCGRSERILNLDATFKAWEVPFLGAVLAKKGNILGTLRTYPW